jgi:hypothetical protein
MEKFRDRSNRLDLLLDDEHYEMLAYLTHIRGSPNFSATVRALIRREYGKTHVVEGNQGADGDDRDHRCRDRLAQDA